MREYEEVAFRANEIAALTNALWSDSAHVAGVGALDPISQLSALPANVRAAIEHLWKKAATRETIAKRCARAVGIRAGAPNLPITEVTRQIAKEELDVENLTPSAEKIAETIRRQLGRIQRQGVPF